MQQQQQQPSQQIHQQQQASQQTSVVSSVPNSLSISVSTMETGSNRQRLSLLTPAVEYHTSRSPIPNQIQSQENSTNASVTVMGTNVGVVSSGSCIGGPPAFKKIRLGGGAGPTENTQNITQVSSATLAASATPLLLLSQKPNQQLTQSPTVVQQPIHHPAQPPPTQSPQQQPPPLLKVDVRDPPVPTGAYHPQVEAISPTLPNDPIEEIRTTKDELLQQITKVDHEINKTERTITQLKLKEASLEEASARPVARAEEVSETQPKHRSLAQKIYADNRKKAAVAHAVLASLSTPIDLPLYNQPSDVEICRDVIQKHQAFKSRLLLYFKKIKSERTSKNSSLAERYGQLSSEWRQRVEKIESSAKRKAKEAKNRELFEKVVRKKSFFLF